MAEHDLAELTPFERQVEARRRWVVARAAQSEAQRQTTLAKRSVAPMLLAKAAAKRRRRAATRLNVKSREYTN